MSNQRAAARFLRGFAMALCLGVPALASAAAGPLDYLFGSGVPPRSQAEPRRAWQVSEFTAISLVPRESGAAENQHPAQINPESLRVQLAGLQLQTGKKPQALFSADEIAELVGPMSEALAAAGPGDDLVMLSTARRDGGFLATPLGVTARLFVQGGALNLMVRDTRLDFANQFRAVRVAPKLEFGTRAQTSAAQISSASATSRRPDWVAIPVAALTGQVLVPVAAPGAAAPAAAPAVVAPAAPPRAAVPAPAPARDAAFYEAQEQRLRALKRLRDQNLITEEEYQKKRREILEAL